MKIPSINWNHRAVKTAGLVLAMLVPAGIAFASAGGGEAAPRGWEATDTYRVFNFVVLAVAVYLAARKPVANALSSRIKGIKEQLEELEAQKVAAEKELAVYSEKLSLLDKEAETIVAEYIRQGEEAKKKILEEAKAAAEKLEEQAGRNIEHEFKNAKMKLKEEVISQALVKAEALLKETITSEDQDRLVDEYLDKVVA